MWPATRADPTLQCIAKQEFAIGPSEADILEHPVVELSELGAFLAAPAPFAQQSETNWNFYEIIVSRGRGSFPTQRDVAKAWTPNAFWSISRALPIVAGSHYSVKLG
jgi:hypothetical protein